MPGRPGHVLAAVDRHVASLVGARPHPPDGVEGVRRKRGHRREVLGERLYNRAPVAAEGSRVEPRAAGLEHPVELLERADRGHRDEQVAPDEADGVLHGALLVAGVGIAVAARAPVAGSEQGEQMGLRHLAPRHPARLGGVVENERRRRAPDLPEDPREALAHALRALGHAGPGVAGVGVRQRDDEQLEREALSGHHGLEVAVVDLRGPRRPLELEIALFGALAVRVSPLAHVASRCGVGALVAPLRDQPVIDALRGMALLARCARIGLENGIDPCGVVGSECAARPRPRLRRRGRHVGHIGVFGDGVAAQPQPPRDLRPRDAHGVHLTYIIDFIQGHGHLLHPFRAGPSKAFARENDTARAAPLVLGVRPS